MDILAWTSMACLFPALLPAVVFLVNVRYYRVPPEASGHLGAVSVLIPARNEEKAIGDAISSVLAASGGIEIEIVVLDDGSTDQTAEIVRRMAEADVRVRLANAPSLPSGWCGKQHACYVLAGLARHDLFLFLDADVRLEPCSISRLAGFLRDSGADLVSGVPRQQTVTILEQVLIPLIHFVLLGFLPLARMRQSRDPSLAAGCGQLFLATRSGYQASGGHAAIRATLHDGIKLPRAFRQAGMLTDLCDATPLARCRMYDGFVATWNGLGKNATEGLGNPRLILPATALLLAGQVAPFVILIWGFARGAAWPGIVMAIIGCVLAWLPRLVAAVIYKQSVFGALSHPIGIVLLLIIQWQALVKRFLGVGSTWRGRTYP
jgi:hypothetical protein